MRLGTRWFLGQQAPTQLPEAVAAAVAQFEQKLTAGRIDTSGWRFTLTWLEGRAIVTASDGSTLHEQPDGSVVITEPE